MGLGNGFIAFAASDPGQRIVLKAGLLPAIAPVRIVNFGKRD
jgi:phosphate transport system substrate-binding protein